ncbi:unnamed protein product [Auanema sp. JU1783]|nr:unnamed protein product [Auanema sp. JU1783]
MKTSDDLANESFSPKFYTSSKTFNDKVKVPLQWKFYNREETFLCGDLLISKYNGLFWRKSTTRTCVLLKNGKLIVYSDVDRGLSINLRELRDVRQLYSEKETKEGVTKALGEFLLLKDNHRLKVIVKGDKSFVTSWRCGIITAHHGLDLPSVEEIDEYTWSQKVVDPHTTSYDTFVNSMVDRALKSNTSMPSLALAYSTLPNAKYSEITSLMRKTNSLCFDRSLRSAPSFLCKNESESFQSPEPKEIATASISTESFLSKDVLEERELDSGVESPSTNDFGIDDEEELEIFKALRHDLFDQPLEDENIFLKLEELKRKNERLCFRVSDTNWYEKSRFNGLPIMMADQLNLNSVMEIKEYN